MIPAGKPDQARSNNRAPQDPLLQPGDPQDLNPYAYAGDSPPSSEDPSGAMQTGGGGVPPNPCGVDAPASCNPNGGGSANSGAPSASGGGGSGRTSAGGSDGTTGGGGYIALSPHVVIEKDDPYYASTVQALANLLSTNPGYVRLLNGGNINTEDWVWTLACHDAGTHACNPAFIPGSDNAPQGSVYVMGAVAGPAGFAIGTSLSADPAYETYFRTMSAADYSRLQATGRLPSSSGETMISPTQSFSEEYSGVLVRFTLKPGTVDSISNYGVSDGSRMVSAAYPGMPPVYSGCKSDAAYFKQEGGAEPQINIGLWQRTGARRIQRWYGRLRPDCGDTVTPEDWQVISSLVLIPGRGRAGSPEDVLRHFGTDDGRALGLRLLRDAADRQDAGDVEAALIVCFTFGITMDHLGLLVQLESADWHRRHEDVVSALSELKSPGAVDALYHAAWWIPDYLGFDDTRTLARKAIWALGGTPGAEAEQALRRLESVGSEFVREKARKRLARRAGS